MSTDIIDEKIDKYNALINHLNDMKEEDKSIAVHSKCNTLISLYISFRDDITEIKSSLTKPSPQY